MGEESSSSSSLADSHTDCIELDVPIFIELKQSKNSSDLGAYSRVEINADQFIGNYKGKHRKSMSQCIDSNYVWTILSSRQIPLFYIDATDPSDSNWLRFIRSTNDPNKYNVICMQQNQQINYFTFKKIQQGEELLTYLPGKKKKPKNKAYVNVTYKIYDGTKTPEPEVEAEAEEESEVGKNRLEQIQEEINEEEKDRQEEQDDEEEEENEEIEFKILNEEIKKKDDYFFTFNFNVKVKSGKKYSKRQLATCDLCTYTVIVDSNYDLDRIIKTHVIDEHLTLTKETEPIEMLVESVCTDLIKQIETNPTCLENNFDNYFQFEANKQKIELLNDKIKCLYCDLEFDQFENDLAATFFKHLKTHKQQIQEDTLVSNIDESNLTDHDLDLVNWSDYFRLNFKDGRFPGDRKSTKTWTCQMCKKQFDQRIDLSKHQCIELNLKLLKKKKELRKKKWKETHWKRKIDLSYIETTSFTQISSNICDNISFCIDGTSQDLKSYSKEVKDYLNTELNNETQTQMFLKCCFPDVYKQIIADIPNLTEANAPKLIEQYITKKSNLYFTNNLTCCDQSFDKLTDYIEHVKQVHSANDFTNSPIGYLSCDPIAYLINLYWDDKILVNCQVCNEEFKRGEIKQHSLDCKSESQEICSDILNDIISELKVCKKRTASELVDSQVEVKKRLTRKSDEKKPKVETIDLVSPTASVTTRASNRLKVKTHDSTPETTPTKKETKSDFVSVKVVNNRKIHTCEKCDLEFTSNNSVIRHQEKSCLRVKVISVETKSKSKSKATEIKKKCPICGFIFTNTHQLSIHIYRQHKSLLGSAHDSCSPDAKRLSAEQAAKNSDDCEMTDANDDDNASWILNESTGDEANVSSSTDSPSRKRRAMNSTI